MLPFSIMRGMTGPCCHFQVRLLSTEMTVFNYTFCPSNDYAMLPFLFVPVVLRNDCAMLAFSIMRVIHLNDCALLPFSITLFAHRNDYAMVPFLIVRVVHRNDRAILAFSFMRVLGQDCMFICAWRPQALYWAFDYSVQCVVHQ